MCYEKNKPLVLYLLFKSGLVLIVFTWCLKYFPKHFVFEFNEEQVYIFCHVYLDRGCSGGCCGNVVMTSG